MSHPFGDLLSQHLHRKHGLSQAKLAAGILQDPSIISRMCRGERLTGPQARERVLAIIGWLHEQDALSTTVEANALLDAAGLAPLNNRDPHEATLLAQFQSADTPGPPRGLPRKHRTNLPAPLTSFIGRTREIEAVQQLIAEHRLVTLIGAGGVGKTRLALEAGILIAKEEGQGVADGVWLLELASLAEPRLIAHNALQLFNIADGSFATPLDALIDYLATRELLLIIDNCEHLVNGCATFIEQLLQRCWHLRILATSREALRIPGERVYPVTPLDVSSIAAQMPFGQPRAPANQLFTERMRAVHATRPRHEAEQVDEEAVAHICRQLDGIPLALELAASLTQSMTLAELAAQLDDQMQVLISQYRTVVPRHRTMHNALAWSFQLLGPEEQRLLARLSVFAGGWTLEAAHAVSNGESFANVKDANARLIQNSLALVNKENDATSNELHAEARYRLLEPVRQFANEQLRASGEIDSVRQRHANYFLALAEQLEVARDTPAVLVWLHRLQRDMDNLRAANTWAIEQEDAEFAYRLNGGLGALWNYSNDLAESNHWLASTLALPASARTPTALRSEAQVLWAAGHAACLHGGYERAHECFERELALRKEIGEPVGIASSLRGLGVTAAAQGDIAKAQRHTEEAIAISRAAQDRVGVIWGTHDRAFFLFQLGDFMTAEADLEPNLQRMRDHELPFGTYRALIALATAKRALGKLAESYELYIEAMVIQQQAGFLQWEEGIEGLSGLAASAGRFVLAVHLLAAAEAHRKAVSYPRWGYQSELFAADLAHTRLRLDENVWTIAWVDGQEIPSEEVVRYAINNPF